MVKLTIMLCLLVGIYGFANSQIDCTLDIRVNDNDAALSKFDKKANEVGGYFQEKSDNKIVVKIPFSYFDTYVDYAKSLGLYLGKRVSTNDLRDDIIRRETRISAKQKLLKDYQSVMEGADSESIITVHEEIIKLIQEIEREKGALGKLMHLSQYATVTVDLKFFKRTPPVPQGSTPFEWINKLNLSDMIKEFKHE